MTDYRMMFDSEHLYAFHLQGREAVVRIEKVEAGELKGEKGRKTKKPIVYFEGKEKPLALNKTNGKIIAAMYTPDTANWVGKFVTLYPTMTEFNGEQRECIRVRPVAPRQQKGAGGPATPEAPEPGAGG